MFRYLNGDRATFRGFQFGARYWIADLAELSVQGAKTIADDIEEGTPLIGRNEPVLGVAPFETTTALRVYDPTSRFWGEYSMRNVWNQQRVAASRLEMQLNTVACQSLDRFREDAVVEDDGCVPAGGACFPNGRIPRLRSARPSALRLLAT